MTDTARFSAGDFTWADALPWAFESQAADSLAEFSVERLTVPAPATDDYDTHVREVVAVLVETRASEPLWRLLPSLVETTEIRETAMSNRAKNALQRRGCRTLGDLCALTINDLLALPNVGATTVTGLLEVLVIESVRLARSDEGDVEPTRTTNGETNPVRRVQLKVSPAMAELIESVRSLAHMLGALGKGDRSPITDVGDVEMPEVARSLVDHIGRLSAEALFPGEVSVETLASRLDSLLTDRDERASAILADRLFADEPATLDELGQRFGVTRERIRQIERRTRDRVEDAVARDHVVRHVAEVVRRSVAHVMPLDALIDQVPSLATDVAAVGQPVWRILDRLDDDYEIVDGWVAAPTLQGQIDEFREAALAADGLTTVADLREALPPQWATARRTNLRRWLEVCGLDVLEGYVIKTSASLQDRAQVVLRGAGEPLTVEQIHDRIGVEREVNSLKNQLITDTRFARVNRESWALTEWGMSHYVSIRDSIRTFIEEHGGEAPLSTLADEISARAGVKRQSVVMYAMSHPFESRRGIVRLADAPKEATKGPELTKYVYARGQEWLHRVVIDHDHLRGSGSLMPPGLAKVLDLRTGDSLSRPTPFGAQTFYWTGMQPTYGSVRDVVMGRNLAEGDLAFFVLRSDGSFDAEILPTGEAPAWEVALRRLGVRATGDLERDVVAVALAIGLPGEPSISAIRAWLSVRGEMDDARALSAAWTDVSSGAPR